jgi:hypothetical protein
MARQRGNEWYRSICLLFLSPPADFCKTFFKGPWPFKLPKNFEHLNNFSCILAVLRIHDILVWIRIRGSMPLTNGSGCGSGSFYFHHWPSRYQQKNNLVRKFFSAYYFLKVLLHNFSKVKSQKEVTKQ